MLPGFVSAASCSRGTWHHVIHPREYRSHNPCSREMWRRTDKTGKIVCFCTSCDVRWTNSDRDVTMCIVKWQIKMMMVMMTYLLTFWLNVVSMAMHQKAHR